MITVEGLGFSYGEKPVLEDCLLYTSLSLQGQGTPECFAEYAAPCPHTVQSAGKGHPR